MILVGIATNSLETIMTSNAKRKANYPVNKYLEGNYTPVNEERVVQFEDMKVIGEMPSDLHGSYVRNGPNNQFQPLGRYHRYDGDGMLHGIYFKDGRATYRNKWIRTICFEEEVSAGRAQWGGMLDPRRVDRPDMPLKDTANTDVVMHAGKLICLWYISGDPYLVDPVTLEPLGMPNFRGNRATKISAHSKTDESTDEFIFFDYNRDFPYMHHGVVNKKGEMIAFTPVELPGPRMPHDMWITRKHTILHDLPLIWDEEAYKSGRVKLKFEENWPTRFGVIPRYGGAEEVRWYEFNPCYILHTINAWEEGDWLHMTGCRIHPNHDAQGNPDLSSITTIMARHGLDARLYAWSVNLKSGATKEGMIDDKWNGEFPTWNNSTMGTHMKYAYCAEINHEPAMNFSGLIKFDLDTGASEYYSEGPDYNYSEAPFAPAATATAEDHGYVISFVRNRQAEQSEVHIFDAQNISDGPVCKLILPCRVPEGFHATWARGDLMNAQ